MRIAREGYKYTGMLLGTGLVLAFFEPTRIVSIAPFVLGLFVAFFFRDPERTPPGDPNLIVAPADGKVVYVGPERGGASGRQQVSVFLSILDVHVNRSPLAAVIAGVRYTPGRFLPAYKSDASLRNEQNEIDLVDGTWNLTLRQIAGVVARRIVFFKRTGDRVEKGERLGLIQFGSRVDVLLPSDAEVRVAVGSRVRAGETVLAKRT